MKLNEVVIAMNPQLSDVQLNVLFRVFSSGGSPEGGAETLKGNDYFLTAAEQLMQKGMLTQSNGGIVISPSGISALKNQGIIDPNNQPTNLAQQYSDSPEQPVAKKPAQQQPQQQAPAQQQQAGN